MAHPISWERDSEHRTERGTERRTEHTTERRTERRTVPGEMFKKFAHAEIQYGQRFKNIA